MQCLHETKLIAIVTATDRFRPPHSGPKSHRRVTFSIAAARASAPTTASPSSARSAPPGVQRLRILSGLRPENTLISAFRTAAHKNRACSEIGPRQRCKTLSVLGDMSGSQRVENKKSPLETAAIYNIHPPLRRGSQPRRTKQSVTAGLLSRGVAHRKTRVKNRRNNKNPDYVLRLFMELFARCPSRGEIQTVWVGGG